MGIITDAFGKLFDFLGNIISTALDWIRDFFSGLFQTLFDFFESLIEPIFWVIGFVFYFVYKLGFIVVLLFQVFVGIGKILMSLVAGIFNTLAGFTYTAGTRPGDGTWGSIFVNITNNGLIFFQLDIVAYILMFLIWFGTAFQAFRIISNLRGGGSV